MKPLPEVFLDINGYPTDEWLEFIASYKPSNELPLVKFMKDVLPNGWYMHEFLSYHHTNNDGSYYLTLSTGGWSGNEEVIQQLLSNQFISNALFKQHEGGKFEFKIKTNG